MPTKWLQERAKGSKNEHGMPPHRAFCGEGPLSSELGTHNTVSAHLEGEFYNDISLVQIHLIIEMILAGPTALSSEFGTHKTDSPDQNLFLAFRIKSVKPSKLFPRCSEADPRSTARARSATSARLTLSTPTTPTLRRPKPGCGSGRCLGGKGNSNSHGAGPVY